MHELDKALFHAINGWPDGWSPFFVFFSEGAKTLLVRALLTLFVLLMIIGKPTRWPIVQALIAWPLADGLTHILKDALQWLRPCVELPDVILRVGKLTSFGTASAHSANMAAVATVLIWRLGWWGVPWAFIALFTGFSRVYVGVHYPSQVLLGWICGFLVALLVVKTWDLIESKRSAVRTNSERRNDAHA